MKTYHAVMIAFGNEFPVTFEAESDTAALYYLDDNYPESSVSEFGDSAYWAQKQADRYRRLEAEYY